MKRNKDKQSQAKPYYLGLIKTQPKASLQKEVSNQMSISRPYNIHKYHYSKDIPSKEQITINQHLQQQSLPLHFTPQPLQQKKCPKYPSPQPHKSITLKQLKMFHRCLNEYKRSDPQPQFVNKFLFTLKHYTNQSPQFSSIFHHDLLKKHKQLLSQYLVSTLSLLRNKLRQVSTPSKQKQLQQLKSLHQQLEQYLLNLPH